MEILEVLTYFSTRGDAKHLNNPLRVPQNKKGRKTMLWNDDIDGPFLETQTKRAIGTYKKHSSTDLRGERQVVMTSSISPVTVLNIKEN